MELAKFKSRCPPGGENAVVVYTVSSGRRDNIDYSEYIVSMLKSYQIEVDERDTAGRAYMSELQTVLGKKGVYPPVVFVKGKQLAFDKMVEMDTQGTLGKLFEGIPRSSE
ncbi:hypothetical protein AQUCO_02800076v1 [Aquilegia coerulea]|uniref:Uncharacterized protein n=1 Tax=Aquilegia coerulea TaxID=218851 RepID=A0A2G5D3T2_AQUCA|nr:hypothetical protein AQUCO_02800076v1 [Aquilegia coerulea]